MIDRQAFRDWLASNPDRVFTVGAWPESCPLSTYARDIGYSDAVMGTTTLFNKGIPVNEQRWFRRFTASVDYGLENGSITAAKVLKLLDEIPDA